MGAILNALKLALLRPERTRYWPDDYHFAIVYRVLAILAAPLILLLDYPVVASAVVAALLIRGYVQELSGRERYHGIIVERLVLRELQTVLAESPLPQGTVRLITNAPVMLSGRQYGNMDAVMVIDLPEQYGVVPHVILEIKSYRDVFLTREGQLRRREVGWYSEKRIRKQLNLQRKSIVGPVISVLWCPLSEPASSDQRGYWYVGGDARSLVQHILNMVLNHPREVSVQFSSAPPKVIRESLKDIGFHYNGALWRIVRTRDPIAFIDELNTQLAPYGAILHSQPATRRHYDRR